MVEQKIIGSIQRYLQKLENKGIHVSFAVVFGSQTRGDSDEWSDIDLIVVSPQFDNKVHHQDVNLLWRVAARIDSRIEPIPCGERQWVEDSVSTIIEIARREGEKILPAA